MNTFLLYFSPKAEYRRFAPNVMLSLQLKQIIVPCLHSNTILRSYMNLIVSAVVIILVLLLYKFTNLLHKLPKNVNLSLVLFLLIFALYNFTIASKLYGLENSVQDLFLNLILGVLLFVTSLKVMEVNKA